MALVRRGGTGDPVRRWVCRAMKMTVRHESDVLFPFHWVSSCSLFVLIRPQKHRFCAGGGLGTQPTPLAGLSLGTFTTSTNSVWPCAAIWAMSAGPRGRGFPLWMLRPRHRGSWCEGMDLLRDVHRFKHMRMM